MIFIYSIGILYRYSHTDFSGINADLLQYRKWKNQAYRYDGIILMRMN